MCQEEWMFSCFEVSQRQLENSTSMFSWPGSHEFVFNLVMVYTKETADDRGDITLECIINNAFLSLMLTRWDRVMSSFLIDIWKCAIWNTEYDYRHMYIMKVLTIK